jgi:RNA-directed DNA polymerase
MKITKEKLINDLLIAFCDAKKHKSKKKCVIDFQSNLMNNLDELASDLINHTYKQRQSISFIVNHPKKREVFASNFRDRVVQHLFFNYTHKLFENTFIADSYACIKKRGTHYGIKRLTKHILQESQNYTKECYCLKLDVRAYFMNINRNILLDIVKNQLDKFSKNRNDLDFDFIKYIADVIIKQNPLENTRFLGKPDDYEGLPKSKTLAGSPPECGLHIGNLTSQMFSNVYMNLFDQYMKRTLKCKHYGRYVDDSYVVSCNKEFLHYVIKEARKFLKNELKLELHEGKTSIKNVKYGVEFLGAYIKPFRTYISNQSFERMKKSSLEYESNEKKRLSIISKLGIMSHYKSYNKRMELVNYIIENSNKNRGL